MGEKVVRPYGSANDLPTVIELRRKLQGMKLLTRVVQRRMRQDVLATEAELDSWVTTVDRFYAVLGPRHWIFTEYLPLAEIAALLEEGSEPEEAEGRFIEVMATRLEGPFWRMGLVGHAAMRARAHHLERARDHYLAEQWDSSALLLVTVIDGLVNDLDGRGFHARTADEMVAWDSVTGHHMGLTAVMPIVLKSFRRRRDQPVYEVHRHGIVHGTVVNYNNQIVATKAWNLLAAVVDWAAARERPDPEPQPTFTELRGQISRYFASKRLEREFVPSHHAARDLGFDEFEVVQEAREFLESWAAGRWGHVAEHLPARLVQGRPGERALQAKRIYEDHALTKYKICSCEFPVPNAAVIHGTATVGDRQGRIAIRWIRMLDDDNLASLSDSGAAWKLGIIPPRSFFMPDTS